MDEEDFGNREVVTPPLSPPVVDVVLRYPYKVPTLGNVLGSLIAGAIFGCLGLWFFAVLVPKNLLQDGVALGGPIGAIVGLLVVPFLVLLLSVFVGFLNGVVRQRAWLCYLLNSHSLAICIPGRPTVYVKRRDCIRCYPQRKQLVLRDGRTVNLGLLKAHGSIWAPLCERWWPEVWAGQLNVVRDEVRRLILLDVHVAGVLWVLLYLFGVFLTQTLGFEPDTETGPQQVLALSALVSTIFVVAGLVIHRWRRRRRVVDLV